MSEQQGKKLAKFGGFISTIIMASTGLILGVLNHYAPSEETAKATYQEMRSEIESMSKDLSELSKHVSRIHRMSAKSRLESESRARELEGHLQSYLRGLNAAFSAMGGVKSGARWSNAEEVKRLIREAEVSAKAKSAAKSKPETGVPVYAPRKLPDVDQIQQMKK